VTLRPKTWLTGMLAVMALAAIALVGTRSGADTGASSSPEKPKPETPLCPSSDHKGCPAGEDDELVAPGASVSGPVPVAASAGPASAGPAGADTHALPSGKPWRIEGDLSEACTCSVPCTCNFGAGPSPHHFCYAIFSLAIHTGHYGDVALDGLHLAAGNAAKGSVWYLDERVTAPQEEALRAIARTIDAKLVAYWRSVDPKIVEDEQFRVLGFQKARIVQEVGEKSNRLEIGSAGRFESDYLTGIDGKTPIVLENNWSWNIVHGIKGQTRKLTYQDSYGNRIDTASSNANQGRFDWNDQTPIYLR
jgi:hypothetical protein